VYENIAIIDCDCLLRYYFQTYTYKFFSKNILKNPKNFISIW